MILIFLLYFLYASIFVIGKFSIKVSQPIFLTGVRMMLAGLISYGIHKAWYPQKSQFSKLNQFDWFIVLLLALFNVYITNAGEFWSLQYLSAGKTSFIYNLSPFFVLIFSMILFSEKITYQKTIGMIIGFLSLVPMLIDSADIIDSTYHFYWLSVAEIVMVCSSAATAFGWVLMRHFVSKQTFTPYFLNGVSMTIGGFMCLVHAFLFETRPFIFSGEMKEFMIYMLVMMFVQNIVAYNLHAYLLNYHTATLISLVSFVMPLMTVIMGYVLLSEPITSKFFACSAGVALGLFIFYTEELKSYRLG